MAIDPRSGQTIIDPVARNFLQMAQEPAPNTQGGFLAPIAMTAAALYREKQAAQTAAQQREELINTFGTLDPNDPQAAMRIALTAATSNDPRMQAIGQQVFGRALTQPDREFDKNLALRQEDRQAQQQAFMQSMRVSEFNANSGHRAAMLSLRKQEIQDARRRAANELDPIQKAVATQEAKALAADARLANKVGRELEEFVALGRDLENISATGGLDKARQKVANFESLKVALVNRWATYINNGNEPTREMVQSLLDQASSTFGLVAGVGRGKLDGFAKTVMTTLGATPEQRGQLLNGINGQVQASPTQMPQSRSGQAQAPQQGGVVDFGSLRK